MQRAGRRTRHRGARRDDDVDRGQAALCEPEGFLDDPPHAVARHGVADGTDRHRQSEARCTEIVRPESHAEVIVGDTLARALDLLEVGTAAQPALRGKGEPGQGVSFLRPFARRRARTFWPFFVAMRARKPCVRARLTLLGW